VDGAACHPAGDLFDWGQCREAGVNFANKELGEADEGSIEWLCDRHGLGRASQLRAIQPSRLAAYAFPRTPDIPTLALCTDLIAWLFLFDDEFADGRCRRDPETLAAIHRQFGGVLHAHTVPPGAAMPRSTPWVTSLGELLGRFDEVAPRSWTTRLRRSIGDYFRGCEAECRVRAEGRWPASSEYLAFRDGSIGVYPMLDLIEFSSGVYFDASTEVQGLANCRRFAALALAVTNDIYSSKKESKESDSFNAVAVLEREYSVSRAIALDMAERLHELLRDACASSVAQAKGQHEVPALVSFEQGFRDWCEGNLRWSTECPRYNAPKIANDAAPAMRSTIPPAPSKSGISELRPRSRARKRQPVKQR
jgi:hypothetical protein